MLLALRILIGLIGALFLSRGLQWMIDPEGAAAALDMTLLSGAGASSQIADTGSFFLVGGILTLWGVRRGASQMLYAPALLLASAAFYRLLVGAVGYGPWSWNFIGIEIALVAILLLAAHYLPRLENK